MLAPNDPRHGTSNGYQNYSCRCADCCAAHTKAHKEYMWRSGRSRPLYQVIARRRLLALVYVQHGTELTYKHGCRCDQCTAGATAARRMRRRRGAAAAEAEARVRLEEE